jgi:hypothetical protein
MIEMMGYAFRVLPNKEQDDAVSVIPHEGRDRLHEAE